MRWQNTLFTVLKIEISLIGKEKHCQNLIENLTVEQSQQTRSEAVWEIYCSINIL